jgi:hypothetical protein
MRQGLDGSNVSAVLTKWRIRAAKKQRREWRLGTTPRERGRRVEKMPFCTSKGLRAGVLFSRKAEECVCRLALVLGEGGI